MAALIFYSFLSSIFFPLLLSQCISYNLYIFFSSFFLCICIYCIFCRFIIIIYKYGTSLTKNCYLNSFRNYSFNICNMWNQNKFTVYNNTYVFLMRCTIYYTIIHANASVVMNFYSRPMKDVIVCFIYIY